VTLHLDELHSGERVVYKCDVLFVEFSTVHARV
jgi:hypothetical protein